MEMQEFPMQLHYNQNTEISMFKIDPNLRDQILIMVYGPHRLCLRVQKNKVS